MPHMVYCLKLKKEAQGLAKAPMPGTLGEKIYANICKEAWDQWLSHQTLLINENRLSMADPKARAFLAQEMEAFLFGPGSAKPTGFIAPASNS